MYFHGFFPNFRLETLRKYARRRLGLDLVEPSKPNLGDDDDYAVTPATTAHKSTASSQARTRATEVQKSKVNSLRIYVNKFFKSA